MDFKKGFLLQSSISKRDKEAHLTKETKLKCPLVSDYENINLNSHEYVWMTVISELQLFEEDCVDELVGQIADVGNFQIIQSLFMLVITSVTSKRYHHELVNSNEFNRGLTALRKVSKLETQVQVLQSMNEKLIQELEIMSNKVKQLEADLQSL